MLAVRAKPTTLTPKGGRLEARRKRLEQRKKEIMAKEESLAIEAGKLAKPNGRSIKNHFYRRRLACFGVLKSHCEMRVTSDSTVRTRVRAADRTRKLDW